MKKNGKHLLKSIISVVMTVALVLGTAALPQLTQESYAASLWEGTGSGNPEAPWQIGTAGQESEVRAWLTNGEEYGEKILHIEGTGVMQDFGTYTQPWKDEHEHIINVTIGDGITNIGDYAFYRLVNLASITIGSSVTSIGECAFYQCEDLLQPTIQNVIYIGDRAFGECDSFESLNFFPTGVTAFADNLFAGCDGLTAITIPAQIESVGENAFAFCRNLTSVTARGGLDLSSAAIPSTTAIKYICAVPTVIGTPLEYNGTNQTAPSGFGYTASGTGKDVGTYTATATLITTEEGVNYVWGDPETMTEAASGSTAPKTFTWSIGPACATVTPKDQTVYIGGTVPDLSNPVNGTHYTVTGLFGSDTLDITPEMDYLDVNNHGHAVPDTTTAGSYEIVIRGPNTTTNYGIEYARGTLTITEKPASSSGGHSGGSSSTPKADANTVKNPDGSTTNSTKITIETRNPDGSVTEQTNETVNTTTQDGSKIESTKETATTTKENADGGTTATTTTVESSKTTATDGTKTNTEIKTETVETLDRNGNGTVEGTTTETVTDINGKVLGTTITESKGTVATDENGTKTTTLTNTATTTDANGNVTTVVTINEKVETKDGVVSDVVRDESGNILTAGAEISKQAVEDAQKNDKPVQVPMEVAAVAANAATNAPAVAITMKESSNNSGSVAKMPRVEIAVPKSGPGIIAMIRNALGKLTPVKECREGSVILPVSGSCEVVIVDNAKSFNDVSAKDWYYEGVTFVTAREIFNGIGKDTFAPSAAMTRGMLAQVLYNFDRDAAPSSANTFADAEGMWFADAASWAAAADVITGTSKGFEGNVNVTREQVATMLYRYAKQCGYSVSASGELSAYSDAGSTSDWATDAMRWAVGVGLMQGSNGKLNPQAPATRAQLAAIMQRFVENVIK